VSVAVDALRPLSGSAPARSTGRGAEQWAGLIWTLVRTDFKARYHGTLSGFVWALLKPVTMFFVLIGVFSFIFASDRVYARNLILGLFLWDFFAEGSKAGIVSMHLKGYLVTKARFPSWIVVVASTSNALITLGVFVLVIMTFLAVSGSVPDIGHVLLFLGYVAALVAIVTGISLAGSALFLRYRDLNQVWEVIVQAGFFVAPIVFPLKILPERFHFYLYVWPPTPIIQFSRAVLVDHTTPTLKAHLMLLGMTLTILGIGSLIFRRHAPRAVEYL
jgi:lipopolysaccharide transport system permease protein